MTYHTTGAQKAHQFKMTMRPCDDGFYGAKKTMSVDDGGTAETPSGQQFLTDGIPGNIDTADQPGSRALI